MQFIIPHAQAIPHVQFMMPHKQYMIPHVQSMIPHVQSIIRHCVDYDTSRVVYEYDISCL